MSISTETVPQGGSENNGRPLHLDPAWRYMPLNEDRKPVKSEAEDPRFWEGAEADWEEFSDWADRGGAIGILPEKSGLVILDCDARRDFQASAGQAQMVIRHGINDLKRVAEEHGEQIPATFTVRTRSGGYHLYYQQNPMLLVSSKGHREGWLIDVKASRNVYAVAPPTDGYTVVRDVEAVKLPLWLASWITTVNQNTQPLGGERMRRKLEDARQGKIDIQMYEADGSLFGAWCRTMLGVVEEAAASGGWNNAIYYVAREFFDVGISEEHALAMIMSATPPWDSKGAAMIARTVSSAWRGHLDKIE